MAPFAEFGLSLKSNWILWLLSACLEPHEHLQWKSVYGAAQFIYISEKQLQTYNPLTVRKLCDHLQVGHNRSLTRVPLFLTVLLGSPEAGSVPPSLSLTNSLFCPRNPGWVPVLQDSLHGCRAALGQAV